MSALAAAPAAQALQLLDASDGVAIEAILSIREPTRIRIEEGRIVDVFGNIYASGCMPPPVLPAQPGGVPGAGVTPAVNPAGEVVIECDREKGEIYVRPIGEGTKPVNLFVSSAQATYTLLLRRADTPADTIVIRDRSVAEKKIAQSSPCPAANGAASHVRGLKAMLVAMAGEQVPSDIAVKDIEQPVVLWREAHFQLERSYRGRGLVGERYRLQNVSDKPMVLAEPEFDRAGDAGGEVAAIAIERHKLRPGEKTRVFVIRQGARP
jgi:conjugal transfer pilus assembly protein TraK